MLPTLPRRGIAIIYKSSLKFRIVPLKLDPTTFEHVSVIDPACGIQYVVIYRPPPSTENGFLISTFLNEFEELMSEIALLPTDVVLLGDFNVHVDIPSKWDAKRCLTCIEVCGFQQHISGSTHKHGHTLDLIITRNNDHLVHTCLVQRNLLSDHHMVHCHLNHAKPSQTKKVSRV